MKRGKWHILAVGASLFLSGMFSYGAQAIDTIPTQFLQEIPLQISAYGWDTNGFSYVQLYNDGDQLLNVNDWQLAYDTAVISIDTLFNGKLEPHKHVIISFHNVVQNATYTSQDSILPIAKSKLILSSKISPEIYRSSEYELKTTFTNWQRSFSTTGEGYTSTMNGSLSAPLKLYDDGLYTPPETADFQIDEIYPYASDCTPTDTSILCGDYIKVHVDKNVQNIENYVLRTDSSSSSRTSSNSFWLGAYQPDDNGYITVYLNDDGEKISLTNSGGYIWIEDMYGEKLYDKTMTRYESAGTSEQGYAWARDHSDTWSWTTTPMPNAANRITPPVEEITVCPTGKYLNPDTNRCRTIEETINALAACAEGEIRNPETNRCRKIVATTASLVACGEGQERNPLTNRCRSIASAVAELLPCDEGYERNPATNRCRKVLGVSTSGNGTNDNTTTGASDPNLTWLGWGIGSVVGLGAIGYGIYEWRSELLGVVRKIASRGRVK